MDERSGVTLASCFPRSKEDAMRLAFRDSSISRAVRLRLAALALTALVLGAGLSHAAERPFNGALVEIRSEDREALETLASGTEELRQAALEVSAHPRLLNRVHNLQRSSSNAFRDLVGDLPRDEQERVWELIRYPDLIASIVDGGRKREAELQSLAAPYPENVREIAVDLGRRQYSLLLRIYALHAQSERDFERELEGHSETTRDAFRTLVAAPELLDLLSDHMHMAVTLGGAYLENPERVRADLAYLHEEGIARREAAEENWRSELDRDPEAREELAEAQREYEETYSKGYDDGWDASERSAEVYLVSYPYWFGYPAWHVNLYSGYPSYYYWQPHHYYGHHGHHGYPGWSLSFHTDHPGFAFGFPSFHFSHWYFSRPSHHVRYSHLTHRMLRHQEHHPGLHHGGYRVTHDWRSEHRGRRGHDWLRDDPGRSHRLWEYGKNERNYRKARAEDPFRHRTGGQFARHTPDSKPRKPENFRSTRRGDATKNAERGVGRVKHRKVAAKARAARDHEQVDSKAREHSVKTNAKSGFKRDASRGSGPRSKAQRIGAGPKRKVNARSKIGPSRYAKVSSQSKQRRNGHRSKHHAGGRGHKRHAGRR